jgi:hypothetical protein
VKNSFISNIVRVRGTHTISNSSASLTRQYDKGCRRLDRIPRPSVHYKFVISSQPSRFFVYKHNRKRQRT